MLRKLLRSNLQSAWSSQKQARLSELREYLCLREGLNNQAAEKASAEFKALSQKYKLDGSNLIQLFSLINYDVNSLQKYFNTEQAAYEREELGNKWRNSAFYDPSLTLDVAIRELQRKYPDVVSYTLNQSERARALKEIEQIFINSGPQAFVPGDDQRVTRFLKEFERGINGLITNIQKEISEGQSQNIHDGSQANQREISERIIDVLTEVYRKVEDRPAWAYARIRQFVEGHREGRNLISETQSKLLLGGRSLEETSIPSTQVADPIARGDDLPLLAEEENNLIREKNQFNFLSWTNDQKPIFEAVASRSQVTWYRALAYLTTGYLLYKLYQGDATNLSLLGLVAVSGFCFYRTQTGRLRNRLNYLVQMNINKSGQSLDLFVKNGQDKIIKIEGVPVRDFRLHRGDYTFPVESDAKQTKILSNYGLDASKLRLSQIRKFGVVTDAWVATYGKEVVFVPHSYQGNGPILEQIFNGNAPQFSH